MARKNRTRVNSCVCCCRKSPHYFLRFLLGFSDFSLWDWWTIIVLQCYWWEIFLYQLRLFWSSALSALSPPWWSRSWLPLLTPDPSSITPQACSPVWLARTTLATSVEDLVWTASAQACHLRGYYHPLGMNQIINCSPKKSKLKTCLVRFLNLRFSSKV